MNDNEIKDELKEIFDHLIDELRDTIIIGVIDSPYSISLLYEAIIKTKKEVLDFIRKEKFNVTK